jgi:hypothetical protein
MTKLLLEDVPYVLTLITGITLVVAATLGYI